MDKSSILRILNSAREKNISNRRLAELCGIPTTTMHRYLSLENDIPADKLYDIAQALGVTVEYIRYGYKSSTHYIENTDTSKLIEVSKNLNDDGNKKLLDYANDLLDNPKYRK